MRTGGGGTTAGLEGDFLGVSYAYKEKNVYSLGNKNPVNLACIYLELRCPDEPVLSGLFAAARFQLPLQSKKPTPTSHPRQKDAPERHNTTFSESNRHFNIPLVDM